MAAPLISTELSFIWSERDITEAQQQELAARMGFTSLGLFQAAADDRQGIRQIANDLFGNPAQAGIDAATRLTRLTIQGRLVDSWETAKTRNEEIIKLAAEQSASRLPKTLPRSQLLRLRQRFEADFGRHQDDSYPAYTLIERRLEEVEEGEVKADPLTEVTSAEETSKEDIMGAHLEKDGTYKLRRVAKSVPLPTDSESLRRRVRLLGITFHLASYKHSSRLWLRGSNLQLWQDHLDYVLGDDVARMQHKVLDQVVTPPWAVVLSYEYQIRKEAVRLIMFEAYQLEDAMKTARRNPSVKEKYFSTPTSMAAAISRSPATKRTWEEQDKGKGSGKGKGKKGQQKPQGKGAGKGAGKAQGKSGHSQTPDGRRICFRFQTKKCRGARCNFVHVCQHCFSEAHPGCECPEQASA